MENRNEGDAASSDRGHSAPEGIPTWVREVLRCPVGQHPLVDVPNTASDDGSAHADPVALECDRDCGEVGVRRRYRIENGIAVLLADEATTVTHPQ